MAKYKSVTYAIYDIEGNFLEKVTTNTVKELSEHLMCDYTVLHDHLHKRLLSVNKQFQVMVVRDNRIREKAGDLSEALLCSNNKPVFKFYKGRFICFYPSLQKASEKTGIDLSSISRCCNRELSSAGGFVFAFADSSTEAP